MALPVRNPNRAPPAVPVHASPFISTRTDIIHPNNPYLQVQLQQLQQQQQKQIEQEAAEEHHAKGFQFRKQGDFRSAIVEYSKGMYVMLCNVMYMYLYLEVCIPHVRTF